MNEQNKTSHDVRDLSTQPTSSMQSYFIPGAIVLSGALIAVALFFSGTGNSTNRAQQTPPTPAPAGGGSTDNVNPVTDEDHIKGDPNAPIMIVGYSDFECPFCKRFHNTMNEIINTDGNEDVAWVYRQFPLEQLHPVKAQAAAVASECANELGGNDAFWSFTDRYMELTPSNNRTNIEVLIPQIVKEIGLNEAAFNTCYESDKHNNHIQTDIANAIKTGGRGTPWSILIAPNGKTFPINGAQPVASVQQLIEIARNEK